MAMKRIIAIEDECIVLAGPNTELMEVEPADRELTDKILDELGVERI